MNARSLWCLGMKRLSATALRPSCREQPTVPFCPHGPHVRANSVLLGNPCRPGESMDAGASRCVAYQAEHPEAQRPPAGQAGRPEPDPSRADAGHQHAAPSPSRPTRRGPRPHSLPDGPLLFQRQDLEFTAPVPRDSDVALEDAAETLETILLDRVRVGQLLAEGQNPPFTIGPWTWAVPALSLD